MKYIGVDIGGTNLKVGIINEDGSIFNSSNVPMVKGENECIELLESVILSLLNEGNLSLKEIAGIGIGVPGTLDAERGIVEYSNNLHYNDFELGSLLTKKFNLPVRMSNDANVATFGEAIYGAGKQYTQMIMLTLGTGVGGGIIINNELYEGNQSKAGELGHVVVKVGGRKCSCGRVGCLESYASATALILSVKEAMEKDKNSKMWQVCGGDINAVGGRTVFQAVELGDKTALAVLEEYVMYLSEGILDFCNIFRPQAIALGGGVCNAGAPLFDRINDYCKKANYGYNRTPAVPVIKAVLGNDAGIIGAAALVQSYLNKTK